MRAHEPPVVYIVILNWNGWRDTLECLESVTRLDYPHYRVVVVDNGSMDGSLNNLVAWASKACTGAGGLSVEVYDKKAAEAAAGRDSDIVFIQAGENLGYAGGCNLGIRYSLMRMADYVFLLNNDATVRPDTLASLVSAACDGDAALTGARVLEAGGAAEFAVRRWPAQLFGLGGVQPPDPEKPFWPSSFASGCALLARRDILMRRMEERGYIFDSRYFMYCEEVDLCLYGLASGYRCVVSRDSVVCHRQSSSSGGPGNPRSYYYLTRNRIFLANCWLGPGWKAFFHFYYLPSRLAITLMRISRGQMKTAGAIISGLIDGYRDAAGKWSRHGYR